MALQLNSTEAVNQTGNGKCGYGENFAKIVHVQLDSHTTSCDTFYHLQLCVKGMTARHTRSVNTPAPGLTTARALRASTATSVKVLRTRPTAGSWAGREQTGVFEEELCYPTGMWSSALEEAAAMIDYCNYQNWHVLAQFTTGTGRLMLWIIVLRRIFISLPTRGSASSRLKEASFMSQSWSLVFRSFLQTELLKICMLPHCYLFLWKSAIAPHYSFKHSCCLHNHRAIWTQNM